MFRFALAAFALTIPAAAAAHSFWLQPTDHTPDPGEELLVEFKVGDGGVHARVNYAPMISYI